MAGLLILPRPKLMRLSARVLRTAPGAPCVDSNGDPAAGRVVLALGRDQWGIWTVVAAGATDAAGHYQLTIPGAGVNDLFVVVGLGQPGEYSVALGDLTAVA